MKIDLGCGRRKQEGFIGVDCIPFENVDVLLNIGKEKWPWNRGSVEYIWCSHTLEHLTPEERIHFFNEAYRVLKKSGKITIVTPHWNSTRAYGDLTHQWPPVSEFFYNYLNKEWRDRMAAHLPGLDCDFTHECSGVINKSFKEKFPEFVPVAHLFSNAVDDLIVHLWKTETKT